MEDLAGHIRGIGRRKENKARRNFHRFTGALHRGIGTKLRDLFGVKGRGDQRRPDRAGRDAIDADAFFDQRLR